MKIFKRIVAFVLCVLCIISFVSCTPTKNVQNKVMHYLNEKYGNDLKFEYVSHTQDNSTSGKYEVKAYCPTTDTYFDIFIYSDIKITDDYSVIRANTLMEDCIRTLLMDKGYVSRILSIQQYNIYEKENSNFSFATVDLSKELSLDDSIDIYNVELKSDNNLWQNIAIIYNFHNDIKNELEVQLKTACFSFNYIADKDSRNPFEYSIKIKSNSETLKNMSYGELTSKLLEILEVQIAEKEQTRKSSLFFIDNVITLDISDIFDVTVELPDIEQ